MYSCQSIYNETYQLIPAFTHYLYKVKLSINDVKTVRI
ncbi:hypothetical protein Cha6605_6182 (plasmid) [Chamaesiphon minutus PCC 6605]|uniref:Uncharacterized protein n=1 Tax=Chamaesiphon minutus (strain ATCC 27169 / PCC 6605) TaxID=1173020 RepID=K9UPJ5_CHAP6|nr:hypothetical protein Cha6605_6182 [Chamaesiphon minutus PCC 6605]